MTESQCVLQVISLSSCSLEFVACSGPPARLHKLKSCSAVGLQCSLHGKRLGKKILQSTRLPKGIRGSSRATPDRTDKELRQRPRTLG